ADPCRAQRRWRYRMTRMTGGLVNFVLRLMLIVATLAVWEALVRLLDVPAFILPTPSSIFTALYRGIASTLYLNHIGITLAETLIGFRSEERRVGRGCRTWW